MSSALKRSQENSLDAALDSFLADRWLPAAWQRVHRAQDLPWRFEQLARRLPAHCWRAYSDGVRLGFAVGKFVRSSRGQTGCSNLAVSFYDSAGARCARGVWKSREDGQWMLHTTLD